MRFQKRIGMVRFWKRTTLYDSGLRAWCALPPHGAPIGRKGYVMAKAKKVLDAAVASVTRRFAVVGTDMVSPALLDIDTDPSSPFFDPTFRHDLPVDPALYASILDKGVVKPIAVVRRGGRFVVVDGRQRTAAAQSAKCKAVPVSIVEIEGYDDTDMDLAIIELNRTAQGVEDLAAARIAAAAVAAGKSRDAVATAMGLTKSKLDAFLALAAAPAVVQKAVEEGKISTSGANYLANMTEKDAAEVIESAVSDRAAINEADPAKASKAATGGASNIDLRRAIAKKEGRELPASAKTEADKKAEAAKPRTGALNKAEIEAVVKVMGEHAAKVGTSDPGAARAVMAAVAALRYAMTGDVAEVANVGALKGIAMPAR